ncbi:MAG: hypothetical protein A3K03_01030 [Bdellovibrionales bacterium RIFOXYD1_FULL_44_7]|nr:MAG: hypothetical protein A3K03_01030 [Bdellovibrionales bacterium RIFOXYD1_FULL_44_7]
MPIISASSNEEGHKYYSFIHAKDLCDGIVKAALSGDERITSGEVFYVSGDETITYEGFLSLIAEKLNKSPLKIRVPTFAVSSIACFLTAFGRLSGRVFHLNLDKLNELRPDYWTCSNEKAKRILGFQPQFDLMSGMANTIDWYKHHGWI